MSANRVKRECAAILNEEPAVYPTDRDFAEDVLAALAAAEAREAAAVERAERAEADRDALARAHEPHFLNAQKADQERRAAVERAHTLETALWCIAGERGIYANHWYEEVARAALAAVTTTDAERLSPETEAPNGG